MNGWNKKTIRDVDVDVDGKRVLLRADYNVPLDKSGQITDDYRITQSLPTLQHLLERGCKVVAMSHLGRPKGQNVASLSLAPIAKRLRELLPDTEVAFVDDCIGEQVDKAVKKLPAGSLLLLENTRFHAGDEANEPEFAAQLAKHGKLFVQDAFGVVHRSHASVTGVVEHLPAVAGLLVEKEVTTITAAMDNPQRPLMAIIGGAKIADKIDALKRFTETADAVAIVGAMANVFLLAEGHQLGKSLVDEAELPLAKEILEQANARQTGGRFTLIVPSDGVVSTDIEGTQPTRVVDLSEHTLADIQAYPKQPPPEASNVFEDELVLDIGPITAARIAGVASQMQTVVWSGTAGVAEAKGIGGPAKPFEHGTRTIVAGLTQPYSPFTIVGGGDTVAYVESVEGLRDQLNHVSTGGSASMELMSGNSLPGLEALQSR